MKKVLLSLSIMAATSAQAGTPQDAFFVEDVRDSMPPLVMPFLPPMKTKTPPILDSDPRSRHLLTEYITNHDGLEWVIPSLGNRQHAFFAFGESSLNKGQIADMAAFAQSLKPNESVIVLSFTDQSGSAEANQELADQRAQSLVDELEKVISGDDILVISSTHWPGDPAKARRAEAIAVRK